MDLPPNIIQKLLEENQEMEHKILGPFGFPSEKADRLHPERPSYRPTFTRDADRIIHSFSFARFFDKTQVFFWIKSDLHQHRMLHVQLVSKLSREIGRVLHLNEDLIEAIALGHDIGHVPFGHDGETILSKDLTEKHGIGKFAHNYESVWFLQQVELQNLSLPVVDGILCHNGESHHQVLSPQRNLLSWEHHNHEMASIIDKSNLDPIPKTLEGCLVRMVDTISYISRDVLDAENLGFLRFEDIPDTVKTTLGCNNRDIINTLVNDLILSSMGKDHIGYSSNVYKALQDLYAFNYSHIYTHPDKMKPLPLIRETFKMLWDKFYDDLIHKNIESKIFMDHLALNLRQINSRFPEINSLENYSYYHNPPEIIVRDYLAGMTDQYFWQMAKEIDPSIDFSPISIY